MVATVNDLVESGQLAESREERNRPTLSFVRTVRFSFPLVATVIVATGCGGTRVETSRIDCLDANDVAITANLVAVVSSAGDFIDGTFTIFCLGERRVVSGAYITGSAGWWNIVSVGPSDAAGVITVHGPASSLTPADIGGTKTVDIIVNGYVDGVEAEATNAITIEVVIT